MSCGNWPRHQVPAFREIFTWKFLYVSSWLPVFAQYGSPRQEAKYGHTRQSHSSGAKAGHCKIICGSHVSDPCLASLHRCDLAAVGQTCRSPGAIGSVGSIKRIVLGLDIFIYIYMHTQCIHTYVRVCLHMYVFIDKHIHTHTCIY